MRLHILPAGCQNSSTGMILLAHMLLGAAIASKIHNLAIAIILSFLSHYLLDLIPHIEYSIENIQEKQWKRAFPQFVAVAIDFLLAMLIIFALAGWQPIFYVCAFFAILPDGLTILDSVIENNLSRKHALFHKENVHFLRNKKFSNFWRISSQVLISIISVIVLAA